MSDLTTLFICIRNDGMYYMQLYDSSFAVLSLLFLAQVYNVKMFFEQMTDFNTQNLFIITFCPSSSR